ncbi:hypothetical protein GWK08_13770 [Leptobacterium flavescens]|uniref:Uncharacterized protein n=1 Tax=Leptobacterium flavescens TaxID=472055 RepID=A0A6P0UNB4_9FLAO|nr:hypothetical protein [Leptobacterium flavescens]NER14517.1 hypothetical protein [Leptobacterium flavescens]
MNDDLKMKIEAYLGNTMPPEEALLFEKQMEENEELLREVTLAREINLYLTDNTSVEEVPENEYTGNLRSFLESDEARSVEEKLRKVQNEYRKDAVKARRRRYFMMAAAIAGLLIISSLALIFTQESNPQELFAKYYSTDDLPSVIKRGATGDELNRGVIAFRDSNFFEAVNLFEAYKKTVSETDPAVHLYLGLSYLQTGSYDKALGELDLLLHSDALDRSKAQWFKALVYLKMDNKKKAEEVLKKILEDPSNFNYAEAGKLLDEL